MPSASSAGPDARTVCTGRRQPGDESPIGERAARATAEGYRVGQGRTPFHGYYYKILTRQGPNARGGAMDYIVRGNMIGGFALVAYPAEYDNSGVMTFIVNQDGIVYEKDLGPNTSGICVQHDGVRPGFELAEGGQQRAARRNGSPGQATKGPR